MGTRSERAMRTQSFPPGWNEQRVKDVVEHYDKQSEDEECAEIEAALRGENIDRIEDEMKDRPR
jgi:hypothetical protein